MNESKHTPRRRKCESCLHISTMNHVTPILESCRMTWVIRVTQMNEFHKHTTHGGDQIEILASPDRTGFTSDDGDSHLLRENFFEIVGTPVKICLQFTDAPVKTCWEFGSRNYFYLISSARSFRRRMCKRGIWIATMNHVTPILESYRISDTWMIRVRQIKPSHMHSLRKMCKCGIQWPRQIMSRL